MIFRGSRYADVKATALMDKTGNVRKFLHARKFFDMDDIGKDFIVHLFVEGEQLDELAFRYFGKERLWWVIADVNEIVDPFEIEAGTELVIPQSGFVDRY